MMRLLGQGMYKTDTVGHDKKYKTTGKKSWDNNAGAAQLGQDSQRMLGRYRQDKKERTGWPEHDRRTGQLGQDNCDGTTAVGLPWQ
jgi:hypothetical protein